jgi:Protein of unknown function (DUF1203)
VLAEVRATASSTATYAGLPVEPSVAEGGEPLRCCLRDAAPGDALLLFNHRPDLPASPYAEAGAVYAHARTCARAADPREYPADWRGRPQVLRAYDARGWIHDATRTHDGTDPEGVIAELLAQPGVVQIHSRNIAWGCYMFTITR